jgi:hypothetical protein
MRLNRQTITGYKGFYDTIYNYPVARRSVGSSAESYAYMPLMAQIPAHIEDFWVRAKSIRSMRSTFNNEASKNVSSGIAP